LNLPGPDPPAVNTNITISASRHMDGPLSGACRQRAANERRHPTGCKARAEDGIRGHVLAAGWGRCIKAIVVSLCEATGLPTPLGPVHRPTACRRRSLCNVRTHRWPFFPLPTPSVRFYAGHQLRAKIVGAPPAFKLRTTGRRQKPMAWQQAFGDHFHLPPSRVAHNNQRPVFFARKHGDVGPPSPCPDASPDGYPKDPPFSAGMRRSPTPPPSANHVLPAVMPSAPIIELIACTRLIFA